MNTDVAGFVAADGGQLDVPSLALFRADPLPPSTGRACGHQGLRGFRGGWWCRDAASLRMPHNNRDELADTIARELKRNHLEHFGHL